jgi:BirA family transcriptional regulator, biotin operon repressor / biotin---[acetyl-CoA-carboxylase] ligase
VARTASTQALADRMARAGAPAGTRVVAGHQTQGRGRLDHGWSLPIGGLYMSIVLKAPPEASGLIPLGVGVQLGRTLADRWGVGTVLKWPNDLLVPFPTGPPRKLAGILVDLIRSPRLGDALVVGMGINVAAPVHAFPPPLRDRVVNLGDLVSPAPPLDEVEVLAALSATSAVEELNHAGGVERTLEACRAALYGVGKLAVIDGTMRGTIRALGEEGELWVDTDRGEVAIRAGEVVVEWSP